MPTRRRVALFKLLGRDSTGTYNPTHWDKMITDLLVRQRKEKRSFSTNFTSCLTISSIGFFFFKCSGFIIKVEGTDGCWHHHHQVFIVGGRPAHSARSHHYHYRAIVCREHLGRHGLVAWPTTCGSTWRQANQMRSDRWISPTSITDFKTAKAKPA